MTERPKMTQRLSDLKTQAHLYALDQEWYIDSFEQKFAELIIEEACRALNPMLRDQISRGHAVDLIKQHFGVDNGHN